MSVREPTPEDGFTYREIEMARNCPAWWPRPVSNGYWIGQFESGSLTVSHVEDWEKFPTFPIPHWLGPFETQDEALLVCPNITWSQKFHEQR